MEAVLIKPNPWMMLPFGALLLCIALGPLFFSTWWGKHYSKVACGLAILPLAYYFLGLRAYDRVGHTAFEYFSFIALIGSLFVVSGGIHINIKGEATPFANTMFLFFGAILANLLGTTGASMLLVRPWIRMNKYRITAHHIVFFIFIVSNVGGCLTPIGDPPLLLGYLMGVPFWWVAEHCFPIWLVGIAVLLTMFFNVDYLNYLKAPKKVRAALAESSDAWRFEGLHNLFFLGVILAAVFISKPPFVREGLMIFAALASYFSTRKEVHKSNHFNFHPIREVAILFVGIFATMMPALDWLQAHAGRLTTTSPSLFYWGSGTLSSVLDNVPTYLCFLKVVFGKFINQDVIAQVNLLIQNHGTDIASLTGAHANEIKQTYLMLQKFHAANLAAGKITQDEIEIAYLLGNPQLSRYIVAISVGAVFFGANTYIGNGPNFMVKSIADHQKVHTPSFIGYVLRYTLPFMLPMLLLVWLLFFRN